jgi:perosamine synthetase
MTDMQAALGLCQLGALDEILAERSRLAERYNEALSQIPGLEPPYEPPYAERTWQSYPVRICPPAQIERTLLMRLLLADGIATRRGVMAIHREASYAGDGMWLPRTERAAREVLLLPLFPGLSDAAQDWVVERLAAHAIALAA